jgi:hypothetical protein
MNHKALLDQAENHRQVGYAALERKDFSTARQGYEQALALYEQVAVQLGEQPFDEALLRRIFYALRALVTSTMGEADYEAACEYSLRLFIWCRQHSAKMGTLRIDFHYESEIIETFIEACVSLKNSEKGVAYLDTMAAMPINTRILRDLADGAARMKQVNIARKFLARAMTMSKEWDDSDELSNVLWAWGKMEHSLNHKTLGCQLCRIALLRHKRFEEAKRAEANRIVTGSKIRRLEKLLLLANVTWPTQENEFKQMGCEDTQ